jgi:peptidyl-prolyl cis-trans isomerase SurA
MKHLLWIIPALLCGILAAEAKTVDRILVQVNDDIITFSDLNRKIDEMELEKKYSGAELEKMRKREEKEALDSLIEEKLLDQKAKEFPAPNDLDSKMSGYIQQVLKQYDLKTIEELDKALSRQGSNLKEFRDRIRKKLLRDDVVRSFVYSRITVPNQEVEKYYKDHIEQFSIPEEVTLSEIDISGKDNIKEAENRANDIYGRIMKGESFAVLASQYSKGLNTSTYQLATLNSDTIQAISSLKEGEISKPQKLNNLFIIYRLDARKPMEKQPLEQVKETIQNQLWDQKLTPEIDRFMSQLKEDAYIQYFTEMK